MSKLYGVLIEYSNGKPFGMVDHVFDSYEKAEGYAAWAMGLPEQSLYLFFRPVSIVTLEGAE